MGVANRATKQMIRRYERVSFLSLSMVSCELCGLRLALVLLADVTSSSTQYSKRRPLNETFRLKHSEKALYSACGSSANLPGNVDKPIRPRVCLAA